MKKTLALICFAAACAAAQTPAAPAKEGIFVTADQLNAAAILPTPPANNSWQTLTELAELHKLQDTRTPADAAHAQADDKEESMFAFADVLGPKFVRAALPATSLLSDHIKANESVIVNPAKQTFKRPRPHRLDTTLKPICKTSNNPNDFSYPSGHGTTGYMMALTLVQMIPEKRDEILARADDYAHSREQCEEHYASDEEASKRLSYAMIGIMSTNPRYKAEVAAAAAETRKALGLPPLAGK